jgi:hypothetical protein
MNIRDLYRDINKFKKVFHPRTNAVKHDLATDCHSILVSWRNHSSHLLNVHGVNIIRPKEKHTAEPLGPESSVFEFEMTIEKLKRPKSQFFFIKSHLN